MPLHKSKHTRKIIVPEALNGYRIDRFLTHVDEKLTRSKVKNIIIGGAVRLNKRQIDDPAVTVRKGDTVYLDEFPQRKKIIGKEWNPKHKIRVVYEDKHFMVIEKPSGQLSVPNHRANRENSVHYVRNYLRAKNRKEFNLVFIVHRLDKETSGLLLFARHQEAQKKLKEMIRNKKIQRRYLAIVFGKVKDNAGRLENYLSEDKEGHYKQKITGDTENGEYAVTNYNVRKRFGKYSLVEFSLETGRTHQIRVQMQGIGHPIMGDKKYGLPDNANLYKMPRLALHAYQLKFIHPYTGRELLFEAPLPAVFNRFMEEFE